MSLNHTPCEALMLSVDMHFICLPGPWWQRRWLLQMIFGYCCFWMSDVSQRTLKFMSVVPTVWIKGGSEIITWSRKIKFKVYFSDLKIALWLNFTKLKDLHPAGRVEVALHQKSQNRWSVFVILSNKLFSYTPSSALVVCSKFTDII